MKISVKTLIIPVVLILCFSLSGCNNEKKTNDITQTLWQCYGKDFTLISSEKRDFGYLDKRMAALNVSATESDSYNENRPVRAAVYKDENGTEFNVFQYFESGAPGNWNMYDDYCVQWLLENTDTLERLDASPFAYTYYNTIGFQYLGQMFCSFDVTVTGYDDIRPAVELAYDIAEDVILPYSGSSRIKFNNYGIDEISENDMFVHSLIPEITFVINSDTRYSLGELRFMTETKQLLTDREQLIRKMEDKYIAAVNNHLIADELPDELLNRQTPDSFWVFSGKEQLCRLSKGYVGNNLVISSKDEIGSLECAELKKLCENAGYTCELHNGTNNQTLSIKRDDNEITISRHDGKGRDRSVFTIKKNGVKYYPEGYFDDVLQQDYCELTIADLKYLFDIIIEVDYEKECAYIR